MSAGDDRRALDRSLLGALLDSGGLSEREDAAFRNMLEQIEDARIPMLTKPQRDWVDAVAKKLGIDARSAAERNAAVPRGREVATPEVLSASSLRAALEARKLRRGP